MASYTDQISTFNPYIQQLPTEAMVQVGMQKQAQYNQGVQKIQSYIDNVAGMDVLRGTDKEYLQSKLNDLGNNLKAVAAGDFSNQQLVNSVGGMATSIVKDPRVQNAVSSTQRAKSELATANNLYKEGKSSLRNVNYLSDQINQYANSTDPNSTFNGKYINYVDLNKKFMDIADNLKKSAPEKTIDQPYKSDAQGNTIYYTRDKKGNVISASIDPKSGGTPEADITMKRFTIKGVSAQDMYDALKDELTADDMEQMKIDAWDHYKGQGPESVIGDLSATHEIAKRMLEKNIEKLKADLHDDKLNTVQKNAILANINKQQDKLDNGSFEKELVDQVEALKDPRNLEKAKLNTYYKKTLNSQATILSNQSYREELLSSPIEAANHARAVLQQTIKADNERYTLGLMNYRLSATKDKWEQEWKEKTWKAEHPGIVTEDMPISTNIVVPTTSTLSAKITGLDNKITQLGNDYGSTLGLNKAGLDMLYDKYKKDPTSVTGNNAVAYVTARDMAERDKVRAANVKDLVEQGSKQFDVKLDDALKTVKGVADASGKTLFTAKDLYDVDQIISKYYKLPTTSPGVFGGIAGSGGIGGGGGVPVFNEEAFRKSIGNDPKKVAIGNALIKRIKGESLTPTERIIADRMTQVHREVDPKVESIEKEKLDYQAATISKYDPSFQQQVGTINKNNKSDMAILDNLIGNTISKLNTPGFGADLQPGEKLDAVTLSKMRAKDAEGKMNVTPIIIKNNDGSALVELHQGDAVQTIHVSAGNFAKYYPEYAKSNPFTNDFAAVASTKNKTTNTGKGPGNTPADAVTAAHTGYEIPGLKGTPWASKVRYDIIGDTHNDGSEDDRFGIRLFIHDNGQWIPVDSKGGFRSGASVQQDIEQLIGPDTISGLLKKHK